MGKNARLQGGHPSGEEIIHSRKSAVKATARTDQLATLHGHGADWQSIKYASKNGDPLLSSDNNGRNRTLGFAVLLFIGL